MKTCRGILRISIVLAFAAFPAQALSAPVVQYTCTALLQGDNYSVVITQDNGADSATVTDLTTNEQSVYPITESKVNGSIDYNLAVSVPSLGNSQVITDMVVDTATNQASLNINQIPPGSNLEVNLLSEMGIPCVPGTKPQASPSPVVTSTPTPTPTHTAVPTPTPTPTHTAVPTPTPKPTHTAVPTPTPKPAHTAAPTATPTPTLSFSSILSQLIAAISSLSKYLNL